MVEVLNKEEARKLDSYYDYDNGDYAYKDNKGIWHLIRN